MADSGAGTPSVGVFTTDVDLVVQSWDAWLERHSGIAAAAAVGQPLTALIPDLAARRLLGRFERALAEGAPSVLAPAFHHFLLRCPPDQPSPHFDAMQQRVTIAPLRADERIAGTIVTIEDVTARLDRERAGPGLDTQASAGDTPVAELRAADWQQRRAAVAGLAARPAPAVVADVLRAMRDEHHDLALLNSALQVLAVADVDVVGPLCEFLAQSDADLRIYAAQALAEHPDPRTTAALLRALDDPDRNVRFHAVEALGKLKAASAVPQLLPIATSGDFFLAFAAVDALRLIGDGSVAPALVPLLADPLLRGPVAEALGTLGDVAIVPALVALLDAPGAPVVPIAAALDQQQSRDAARYGASSTVAEEVGAALSPRAIEQIIGALHSAAPAALRPLVRVLSWADDAAASAALVALLGQAEVRPAVIEALVRFGSGVTAALLEQLEADEPETRAAALLALGRVGDAAAVPAVLAVLDGEPELQVPAAEALAKIGDHRAFEPLLARIGHPDVAVRQAVIAALNSLGHPALEPRVTALLAAPDPLVRESALRIAGYFGYAAASEQILAACADGDERVRQAALEALPFLDEPRAIAVLGQALAADTPRARAAAARALGQSEAEGAAALLIGALGDVDPWVRYFAVRALGLLGADEALPRVAELLADPAGQVRIAALEALGRLDGAAAVELLTPHIDASDADESRAALRALGRTRQPGALGPLRAALRNPAPLQRRAAVDALAEYGSAAAVPLLQWAAAVEDDAGIRDAAVATLGQNPAPEAVAALIELLVDPKIRAVAAGALARKGAAVASALQDGLAHPSAGVRAAVVELLARSGGPAAEHIVGALDDAAPAVRLAAIGALAHMRHGGALPRLTAMAQEDADPAVRRAARALLMS